MNEGSCIVFQCKLKKIKYIYIIFIDLLKVRTGIAE